MKKLFFYIIAAVLLSLTACDKEEEAPAVPGAYSWNFGYIKGRLNGTDFNLQNEDKPGGCYISTSGAAYSKDLITEEDAYGTNIPITKKQNELTYGFSIHIAPVKTGMFEIKGFSHNRMESSVYFIDERNADEKKGYIPMKQPLKLCISRADFSSDSSIPFIEGEMDGILYNEKNPNDSIVVENIQFGVHG